MNKNYLVLFNEKNRDLAHEKRACARSSVCTFNLCHITKI